MTPKQTKYTPESVVLSTDYVHGSARITLLFDPDNDDAWLESDMSVAVEE
ncbi:hypothetical protein [Halorussus halophilus]|nr:hypothetical protein [Halorussus halophilus]